MPGTGMVPPGPKKLPKPPGAAPKPKHGDLSKPAPKPAPKLAGKSSAAMGAPSEASPLEAAAADARLVLQLLLAELASADEELGAARRAAHAAASELSNLEESASELQAATEAATERQQLAIELAATREARITPLQVALHGPSTEMRPKRDLTGRTRGHNVTSE